MLNGLYNQVDEEVHKLVILSNKSQKELESLLEVRRFEEQTQQVSSFLLALVLLLPSFGTLIDSLLSPGQTLVQQRGREAAGPAGVANSVLGKN